MRRVLLPLILLLTLLCACKQDGPLDLESLAGRARGGDAAASARLLELLGVTEQGLSDRVYPVVLELGVTAVPQLLPLVKSGNVEQREHVIAALGTLKVREAIPPIGEVLTSRDLGRRYIAAWALGEIGEPAGIPYLLGALDDNDGEVRKYATRALIKLNRAAVAPLVTYLPAATARGAGGAIRALGDIGDPAAVEVLLAQAGGPNRPDVFLALGKLKDGRARSALVAGLADRDWRVRMNAAMALGPVGGTEAVAPLQKTLEDEVHVVREWSARSLEVITGRHIKYRNEKGEYVAPYSIYH